MSPSDNAGPALPRVQSQRSPAVRLLTVGKAIENHFQLFRTERISDAKRIS